VKSVSGYYGNINFEQEAAKTEFRKTKGTDLNMVNPYLESSLKMTNLADIKTRVIEGCKTMSPANGLRALRVALKRLDHNQNGLVEPVEFKYGLRAFGIDLNEDECSQLLKNFDPSRSGRLSVNEILHILRKDSFNDYRAEIVEMAYRSLDQSGRQLVTIEDLENNYDVQPNPEYVMGTKSGSQIMTEFL
jgi:Ca2+-binding EF-hand superfamily protein